MEHHVHASGPDPALIELVKLRASLINSCAYCVGHVADDVYELARAKFTETELVDLTLTIVTINGWNRLSVAFRAVPGSYQLGE